MYIAILNDSQEYPYTAATAASGQTKCLDQNDVHDSNRLAHSE
jgi:hypothetical protein